MSELDQLRAKWKAIEEEKAGKNKKISEAQQIAELKKKIKDYEFSKTKTGAVVKNLKAVGTKIFAQPQGQATNKKTKQKPKSNSTNGLTMEQLMKM